VQSVSSDTLQALDEQYNEALDIAYVLKDLNAQQAKTIAEQRIELARLNNRIVELEQLLKPDAPTP
jgi:hypothetical protein